MRETGEERDRFGALLQWKEQALRDGADATSLPLTDDLRRIARIGQPTQRALERLPYDRKSTVIKNLTAILTTLGAGGSGETSSVLTEDPVATVPPQPRATGEARNGRVIDLDAPRVAGPLPVPRPEQFAPTTVRPWEPQGSVRASAASDGMRLEWSEPATGDVVLYRVVASDDYEPYSPDSGRYVEVTRARSATDTVPLLRALRHVSVWANCGRSDALALAAQPQLVGRATLVAPVRDVAVASDEWTVTGTWSAPEGTRRVEVLRVPAGLGHAPGYLPMFRLELDDDGLHGFTDHSAERGRDLEYRIFTVADVGGVEQLSPPVVVEVHVEAPLLPVLDLVAEVRAEAEGTVLDLSWTPPPNGELRLYRTAKAPGAGSEDKTDLTVGNLESAGLPEATRIKQARSGREGRAHLRGVPWPEDLTRVHVTPVTVVGDRVRVGKSVALTRIGKIHGAALTERVGWQLLTFAWPAGAAAVHVHITPTGTPLDAEPGAPDAKLDHDAYLEQGGLRLQGVLPARGCDLHLVPVSYYEAGVARGAPTTVSYRGLLVIEYRLLQGAGGLLGGVAGAFGRRTIEVRSQRELRQSPPLVLVHNPDRLPLDVTDGEHLLRFSGPLSRDEWAAMTEVKLGGRKGWFRLFVDYDGPGPGVALLDPPVATLHR